MHKEACFFLGRIVKKHGFKGALTIKLDTDEPEKYEELESVFVEIDKQLVPFFIRTAQLLPKGVLRVHFEGIDSEEEANRLMGSGLYLPLEFLPPLGGNRFYYHEIIGFQLIDTHYGPSGTITQIIDHTAQPLIQAEKEGKEVLIPMNDDIIKEVNRGEKTILIEAPEGLIDLYLGSE